MGKGKDISKWRNANIFLCLSRLFCTCFGVNFPHCNLETTSTGEVLFDKCPLVACLKWCMEIVIHVFSVRYWFIYWDLKLFVTNVLGSEKKSSEIENLLLKIALTAPSKISFLNDILNHAMIYLFLFHDTCIKIKVPSKHPNATEHLPYGQIHFFRLSMQSLLQNTFFSCFW